MSGPPLDPLAELAELAAAARAEARRRARRRRREQLPAAPHRPCRGERPSAGDVRRKREVEVRPPSPAGAAPPSSPPPCAPPGEAALAGDPPAAEVQAQRAVAAGCQDLEALADRVAACTACALCRTRSQTVFSDGPQRARLMFVGEAPGAEEDRQGIPFVGRAGRLLTDIIEKGMGLARADVYIANVIKCRPPENRDPTALEKALCTPFLERQIELVDPEVIVPLGRHASGHLLGTPQASMGRMRGRVHQRGRRKLVPTYHPAFLLRTPRYKRDCWEDIQLAMAELGLEVPARPADRKPR